MNGVVTINLREFYDYNANQARNLLETECDDFFWSNINLLLSVKDLCENSKPTRMKYSYLKHALFNLSSDFVNLAVASYKLLSNAFEKECFLIIRKGYETIWLLDTFTRKPNSIKTWYATDRYNQSNTYPIDIKKEGKLYQRLSKFVHPNSQFQGTYMGLLFVEVYTYQIFFELIVCICNMIESLFKALEKINNISINKYREHKDWFSAKERLLHSHLIAYDNNLAELDHSIETKLIQYF
ncbi:hypothetical protein MMB75_15845 [Paenibacillus sp. P2(2022)]|nr:MULTISPECIES: hypothetical protein [Paenibacillus]KJK32050.1 hypothetical protein TY89_05705 [Paenibacillus polymyxa]MDG0055155.1 hypothetical protein [Paenibacillus sp. P2(2022)]MDN4076481.1 hypothetical protein [Paenibacillus polymyxa]MDN4101907.1 hypothetical protein [Paenibacillus polymyxa]NMP09165.1 hypothetical protein [Paenibacillus polymyxa]